MATKALIDSFHQYAMEQLNNTNTDVSIDSLYQMWRASNPSAEELAASVNAVQVALDDMATGDKGVAAHEHLEEIRRIHRLPVTG